MSKPVSHTANCTEALHFSFLFLCLGYINVCLPKFSFIEFNICRTSRTAIHAQYTEVPVLVRTKVAFVCVFVCGHVSFVSLCVPSRISFPMGWCPCVIARAFMCTRQLDVYLHVYRVDIYK